MEQNNLGKNLLTDQCEQIRIDNLVRKAKKEIKKFIIDSNVQLLDQEIRLIESRTGFGGCRLWFICPLCQKRVGIIYKNPFNDVMGCRVCLNLKYRKQRYKGMIENSI